MVEAISNFFVGTFGDNIILAAILIAMVPVIELRGAIPFAINENIWKLAAMTEWEAFGWCLLGSSLIVPILALLFVPIINLLKKIKLFKKLALAIENRIKDKASGINADGEKSKFLSKGYWKKVCAVFIFVAIPLPLTGVWTGTCVSIFIGLDFFSTCLSVILGNVVAGLMITAMTFIPVLGDWLLVIFLGIVILIVLIAIIKHFVKKKTNIEEK